MENKILSVKEIATKYGLTDVEHCMCGGTPTDKFRDPKRKYLLSWRKNRWLFKFRLGNKVEIDWTPVKELQAYMDKYFKDTEAARNN